MRIEDNVEKAKKKYFYLTHNVIHGEVKMKDQKKMVKRKNKFS